MVYPALVAVDAERWGTAHAAHGRAITPIVVLTYGMLLLACAWALVVAPTSLGVWVAVAGTALAVGTTAVAAAPTHGALAEGPEPTLLHRLRMADRVRLLGAVIAVCGAGVVVL